MNDVLQRIQQLQFTDRGSAEALLIQFIHDTFSLDVVGIDLRPTAVSLNSFNGFLHLRDGTRLFFKTHTESDNVIGEYYRAAVLAEAGYPVIQPRYSSTEAGKHLLIYDVIEDPSVFDVAWAIENGDDTHAETLRKAQNKADQQLWALYLSTLSEQSAEEAAQSPIHQLFHHRLTKGRLDRFYGSESMVILPNSKAPMRDVRHVRWAINGQVYDETLDDIIQRAVKLLEPSQAGPAVTGHGDAHNGNVFLTLSQPEASMLYFDPAFAGNHHPLLDIVKPLFHNVFAMWMYYPEEKRAQTSMTLKQDSERWIVEHDYVLHPVREMFLASKVEHTLSRLYSISSERIVCVMTGVYISRRRCFAARF